MQFLEAFADLTIVERNRLLRDARDIRDGRMPSSYQQMVARERPAFAPERFGEVSTEAKAEAEPGSPREQPARRSLGEGGTA